MMMMMIGNGTLVGKPLVVMMMLLFLPSRRGPALPRPSVALTLRPE